MGRKQNEIVDKLAVIIVAGGSGMRMQTETPKQFLLLEGRPMLMKTIEAFEGAMQIVVVLPREWFDHWRELCEEYNFGVAHDVVEGGSERFYSVKNGLDVVEEAQFVAVHDGVRPFVTKEVILNVLEGAKNFGAAIPVVEVSDSIRMIEENGESKPLKRSSLRAVQTPQIFNRQLIEKAYEQPFCSDFTDDASVVEKCGAKVKLIDGNVENIKITYKRDFLGL